MGKKRIKDLNITATASDLKASNYFVLDGAEGTKKLPADKVLAKPTSTISAFRTGDVIPVDGPNGTAKMGKDDMLKETAQNAFNYSKELDFFATKQSLLNETARATAKENELENLFVLPTEQAVATWLEAHPEATTTVQDRSITEAKIAINGLGYVTPEMYGAKGDGVTDDYNAFVAMFASGHKVFRLLKTYFVKCDLVEGTYHLVDIPDNSVIIGYGAKLKGAYRNDALTGVMNVTSGCFIAGLTIDNMCLAVKGSNVTIKDCICTWMQNSGCFSVRPKWNYNSGIVENVLFENCIITRSRTHGFSIYGGNWPEGDPYEPSADHPCKIKNVAFLNCAAYNCGYKKNEDVIADENSYACGFVFGVNTNIVDINGLSLVNCRSVNSAEDGFHFEDVTNPRGLSLTNCSAIDNGLMKPNATYGAGFLFSDTTNSYKITNCFAFGNRKHAFGYYIDTTILPDAIDISFDGGRKVQNGVAKEIGGFLFSSQYDLDSYRYGITLTELITAPTKGLNIYANTDIVTDGWVAIENEIIKFKGTNAVGKGSNNFVLKMIPVSRLGRYEILFKLLLTQQGTLYPSITIVLIGKQGNYIGSKSVLVGNSQEIGVWGQNSLVVNELEYIDVEQNSFAFSDKDVAFIIIHINGGSDHVAHYVPWFKDIVVKGV